MAYVSSIMEYLSTSPDVKYGVQWPDLLQNSTQRGDGTWVFTNAEGHPVYFSDQEYNEKKQAWEQENRNLINHDPEPFKNAYTIEEFGGMNPEQLAGMNYQLEQNRKMVDHGAYSAGTGRSGARIKQLSDTSQGIAGKAYLDALQLHNNIQNMNFDNMNNVQQSDYEQRMAKLKQDQDFLRTQNEINLAGRQGNVDFETSITNAYSMLNR